MKDEVISQIPMFANLPEAEIKTLVNTLRACSYQPGAVVFNEGTQTSQFYIVQDGEVEIVKSLGTADERVVALSTKGAILGEMSRFSQDGSHTASARALTALTLLEIPFSQFDAILLRHPALAIDLLRLYSQRLEKSESQTIQDLREKNRQLTAAYHELQTAQAAMIEKERLERELQIAAEIQRGILPEDMPVSHGLDFGALMIPARQVGGDFYDFIQLDDHRIGIVVGDVCDKGVPAALFMALTYSSIRTESSRLDSPGNTLRAVNRHLLQVNRSAMFVTLLYGVLDCATGEFSYARAGHPAPLVLDSSGQLVKMSYGFGQPIGLFDEPGIDEQSIIIPPGGTLLAYSDGLSETIDDNKSLPALPDLCSAALRGPSQTAQALCDYLWRAAGGSPAASQIQDDFTVVVLKRSDA